MRAARATLTIFAAGVAAGLTSACSVVSAVSDDGWSEQDVQACAVLSPAYDCAVVTLPDYARAR